MGKMDDAAIAIEFLKQGQVPTPEEIRQIINSRIGYERTSILSNHVYWKEMKLKEGFNALVSSAHAAYIDICRHNAALTSFSHSLDNIQDHVDYTVVHPCQKDVMAFCGSVHATIDTVRRIREIRPDIENKIAAVIAEYFSSDVCDFIKDLRKNLSHGSVVIPGYLIQSNDQGITGLMKLETQELSLIGKWSAGAKRYIARAEEGQIDVAMSCGEYFELLTKFDKEVRDIFARHVREAERDYYDIEDAAHRWASQQWMKIIVSQIGKGKNPYEYLHHYFKPNEVREILRRPNHSKEQVDYIILLKSTEIGCDDDLRNALYEIFQVPVDT